MRRVDNAVRTLFLLCILTLSGCAEAHSAGLQPLSDQDAHWQGWIELVPAILLPQRLDPLDDVRVYARFNGGGLVELSGATRSALRVPHASEFDRVESWTQDGTTRVVDVRGTLFSSDGEVFHVYRPLAGVLHGRSWVRAEYPPPAILQALRPIAGPSASASEHFMQRLHCASCHGYQTAERRTRPDGAPRRPTDASGLYSLLATLNNTSAIETYKPHDPNRAQPYTSYACVAQSGASTATTGQQCPHGQLLYATYDLAQALAAHADHAQRLCRSRRQLLPHLSAQVRAAYQSELEECAGSIL